MGLFSLDNEVMGFFILYNLQIFYTGFLGSDKSKLRKFSCVYLDTQRSEMVTSEAVLLNRPRNN